MAAAYVSGIAALIWANEPHLTARQVRARILGSVQHVPGLERWTASGGVVRVDLAMQGGQVGLDDVPAQVPASPPRIPTALDAGTLGWPFRQSLAAGTQGDGRQGGPRAPMEYESPTSASPSPGQDRKGSDSGTRLPDPPGGARNRTADAVANSTEPGSTSEFTPAVREPPRGARAGAVPPPASLQPTNTLPAALPVAPPAPANAPQPGGQVAAGGSDLIDPGEITEFTPGPGQSPPTVPAVTESHPVVIAAPMVDGPPAVSGELDLPYVRPSVPGPGPGLWLSTTVSTGRCPPCCHHPQIGDLLQGR